MIWLFWIGAGWLLYVYAGYPLGLALISLFRRGRPLSWKGGVLTPPERTATPPVSSPRPGEEPGGSGDGQRLCGTEPIDYGFPAVSVLIAARNEEKDIAWKISETLSWDYPADRLEVLVASDASGDRTDEIVRGFSDSRVTLLRLEKRGGKGAALNRLAPLARGDLLFFTDANASIAPQCLRLMVRHFADARVGCVTGECRAAREEGDPVIPSGANAYWGCESVIKRLENRLGSVLVCDGAIFCIRRSLYVPLLPELANDLELPMRIFRAGYRIRLEPGACVVERDSRSPREEFHRRRRVCAQGALGMWKLRQTFGGLRGWQFVSHKLLRWLTLVPLLFILFSTLSMVRTPLFAGLFALQAAFYLLAGVGLALAAAGRGSGRIISVPFYVLLGATGAIVGVAETVLGHRFAAWEIPVLSRGSGGGI